MEYLRTKSIMYGKSDHLIYFFLHFVVVITCSGKTFLTFRTMSQLSLRSVLLALREVSTGHPHPHLP